MKHVTLPFLSLALLVGSACASTPAENAPSYEVAHPVESTPAAEALPAQEPAQAQVRATPVSAEDASASAQDASAAAPAKPAADTADRRSVDEFVASVWQDPGFRRRVQESLILRSDVEPSMTQEERESLTEVVELISASKHEEALRMLEELSGPEATPQFDFMRAYVQYFLEDLEGAALALETAVQRFPNFLRAWQLYGQVLMQREDFRGARMALSEALKRGGADADLYGALGFCYTQLEDHMASESCYRMSALLDPETLQWKEALAMSFYRQSKFEELVTYTGTLLQAQPESARLWDMQAKGYIRLNQPLRAAENYELIDMMGLSDFTSLATLADIYVNESLFDLAVGAYSRAITMEKRGAADRPLMAAQVMVANTAYDEGIALVDAIERSYGESLAEEQSQTIWRLRALTASLTDVPAQQIAALKELISIDPLDGQALMQLGRVYLQEQQYVDAALYFERAEDLEKYAARAKLGHAQALVGQDKYTEAATLLRASLALEERESVRQYLRQIETTSSGR